MVRAWVNILVVTTFSVQEKNNIHIVHGVLQGLKESAKSFFSEALIEYTHVEDGIEKIKEFKPDIVILFGTALKDSIDFGALSYLAKEHGSVMVFWATDEPYEFDARYRFIEYFDHIFINDFGTCPYYFKDEKVHHLPLAACIKNDYREMSKERDIDFFFCGYPYKNRRLAIQDLCNVIDPRKVTLSSGDWGVEGCNYVDVRTHKELVDYYSRSKFVINIGRTYNLANDYYSLTATTPGPRTFEAALAGCAQVYISNSPEIYSYYHDSKEIIVMNDVRDVASLCSNDSDWIDISYMAQKRTLKEHLYVNRADVMLGIITDCS